MDIPEAPGTVLSTLNADGSRRWIRPRPTRGRFFKKRLGLAWGLILLFVLLPVIRLGGEPLVLLDLAHRRFTLFGTTFLPTDTGFLMLLVVGLFLGIFLLTALFGRVFCGWACPQTVYMEFLYRPLERLIEGDRARQMKLDREGADGRRILKWFVFLVPSVLLAHVFLAYFVPWETLLLWITRSPFQHPAGFLIVAATAGLMFLDFAFFREQVCFVACPYGRIQSVLLDRHSLIVGYDPGRGEPRRRVPARRDGLPAGDCIDCNGCVITCPTGIDIRDGLQMECVGCTQCIDACDAIMEKTGRPRGLIRYTSPAELAGERPRRLRPRVVLYPLLLLGVFGLLAFTLARRTSADVTLLRGLGSPFNVLPSGEVSNQVRVKIVNRSQADRSYRVELAGGGPFRVVAPQNPLPLPAGRAETTTLFVIGPAGAFPGGRREIHLRVDDGAGFSETWPYLLLGPEGAMP